MRSKTTSKQRWGHRSKHRKPAAAPTARLDHNRSIIRSPLPPSEDEHYACFEQPEYLAQLAREGDTRMVR